VGEGGRPITDAARPWALPLVVALGGLLSGLLVFRLAPEAEGHGTDAAIAAYHHNPRGIRGRVPVVKLFASAITIGSGGSGGREGPTAQISAGFASFLGRALDLDAHDTRIAVSVGMAAGIGAIFRAPLGGALMGAELLYRDDLEPEGLAPSFLATIVAYSIFGAVEGFDPIFGVQGDLAFSDPAQLGWYVVLGLVCGLVGLLYATSFYGLTDRFRRLALPAWLKPAIGGFLVGCIGLVLPGAIATGYGYVAAGLDAESLMALPLWIVLVLPFAKILATSLSIGSGGSGGIFGPGMVIGGLLGAGMWRLLAPIAPAVPADPAPFVIVAMMALFGSIAHAPPRDDAHGRRDDGQHLDACSGDGGSRCGDPGGRTPNDLPEPAALACGLPGQPVQVRAPAACGHPCRRGSAPPAAGARGGRACRRGDAADGAGGRPRGTGDRP
jgi:CIC family chloride channel protein